MKPLLKKFRALSRGQDNREVGTPALLGTFVDKLGWKQREPHESPNKLHFLRKGQTGLVQLDSLDLSNSHGAKPFNIDIVAIHGLGGDIRETWTHKDGTFWLQDLLPRSLPGARVFSYGYPSDIFLSRSVADIRDISINLLNALETIAWKDVSATLVIRILSAPILTFSETFSTDSLHMSQPWRHRVQAGGLSLILYLRRPTDEL